MSNEGADVLPDTPTQLEALGIEPAGRFVLSVAGRALALTGPHGQSFTGLPTSCRAVMWSQSSGVRDAPTRSLKPQRGCRAVYGSIPALRLDRDLVDALQPGRPDS
ncbi:hypothetical protein [Brevibacterium iodinum]|nr:hypothetical protein [Brevibacterium iodinum]